MARTAAIAHEQGSEEGGSGYRNRRSVSYYAHAGACGNCLRVRKVRESHPASYMQGVPQPAKAYYYARAGDGRPLQDGGARGQSPLPAFARFMSGVMRAETTESW
jgi:hypothetical protein